jgi:hypothetical protein
MRTDMYRCAGANATISDGCGTPREGQKHDPLQRVAALPAVAGNRVEENGRD